MYLYSTECTNYIEHYIGVYGTRVVFQRKTVEVDLPHVPQVVATGCQY